MALFHARIWRYFKGRLFGQSRFTYFRPLLVFLLYILAGGTTVPRAVFAVEEAENFVKGLQERGLHDLALEYLEGLKTSPLANDGLRTKVPYLRGIALIEQSRQASDPTARNSLLDGARKELEQFAEANPRSVQGAEAQLHLATVQMTRGQELLAQAHQLPAEKAYDSQRKDVLQQSRLRFAEARDTFQRAETTFNSELEKLPPAANNETSDETGTQRQQYRGRVAQLRCLAAQSQFETARSYAPESDEYKRLNKDAADELGGVYEEFGRSANSFVALYAHLAEGRCYQALGEHTMALGCYEDVLRQPNVHEPFRKLIASAVQRKAEVLISQQKYDLAVQACAACLKEARKDEEKQSEWLAVRFRLAEALAGKGAGVAADSLDQKRLLAEAREAYRTVARTPNEFQSVAKTALTVPAKETEASAEPAKKEEPRSFAAAYDLGKEALASYNAAKLAIPSAQKNNPSAVPELQAQMERGTEDARHYFRLAATLVEADTDLKLVNEVRYFLCWLYWEAEDYYRAAVSGEFLARRYPDHPAAASAAKISMASFERLLNQALATTNKQDGGDFEAGQMARMAEFIVRRWPGSDDAHAAFGVLVSLAIRSGNMEEAEKLLAQASPQSRPRLELLLGNALWSRYLELAQAEQADNTDQESLAKLKDSAAKYIRSGYESAQQESPTSEAGATSALYLAQYLLSESNYADAISLLEDPKMGPLTLIAQEHPTAMRPQYAIEAYKAALRAYVSVTPPQEAKALSTMHSLEQMVQSQDDGNKSSEQLTRIYIGMGVALQKQMEDLRASGKQQEAMRVAAAFAKFLDRINAQSADAKWPARVWLAQMYFSLGATDTQRGDMPSSSETALSPASREYLTKARDAYEHLLKAAAANPQIAPSDTAVLAAKSQLGETYRMLGQYQSALDTFSDILKAKETSLAVQRAAALAYQERGQHEDPKWFESAIYGGQKSPSTGQNLAWGWLRISQVAGRAARQDEKFREAFYEARFNISRSRFLAALKLQGDARRQNLVKAKQSIQSLVQLYPDLGGDKWKPRFEALLKDIEREEGKLESAAKD